MPARRALSAPADSAHFVRFAQPELELLHARFYTHRFASHAHDSWAIGAVIRGAKDTSAHAGKPMQVAQGELYALAPHVAHAGRSLGAQGCEYVMIYVPDTQWRTQCALHGVSPHLLDTPLRQRRLVAEFAHFAARALAQPQAIQAYAGEWTLFCERVLGALSPSAARLTNLSAQPAAFAADPRVRRIGDYLHTHAARNVSLDELASEASLSVSELCRRFSAAYGLSPHRYQLVLRLRDAKRLLLGGAAPSEAALATGFADQSHLGRHFKAMFGVTPGSLAGARGSARTF
ncbi:MAG TPA: AraC family transcriptional regulator [Paraburkholderia sp.]|jgi:AraC-like DNA-binding protein|nr:AraC family transcriptional regulator [Paraburkholderia sp.]